MHIPDGYLSPSTCGTFFCLSTPFWLVAGRRLGKQLQTRLVPRLSLVSAFCFVVMMFNIPVPGGTSVHAVGMGLAAVILGPWAATIAISVALVIQALFFGDGGVLALGANCFNMAIVGSFVAYAAYRLLAGKAPLTGRRRVTAAAVAGYLGINLAALAAALEFGLQPILFHNAHGVPLYAPYPLHVALPAMMVGHLTLAGPAEAIATAALVAWLQANNPSLLEETAGLNTAPKSPRRSLRPLLIGMAALVLLTPLGLLGGGTAWGEWSAHQFQSASGRSLIQNASQGIAPPAAPPAGLAQLSPIWQAPLAGYQGPKKWGTGSGYLLSALCGVVLIALAIRLLGAATKRRQVS